MKVKTVYVEITNICNLNCATCYNRSGLNRCRKELTAAQLEKILQTFKAFGLQTFLFSGGEPTLHTEFNKILAFIDRYPEITFGFVTNGTTQNKQLAHYLNTRPNCKVQISLDGSNEEVNAKTRGKGNFAKTVAFAKMVQTPAIQPLLKMVVSQNNFNNMESFCNLALSLNFTPELAAIYRSGNGETGWENKALTQQQRMKILKLAEKINREKNANIFLPSCTVTCPFVGDLNELSLCIKVDGSVQPCQSLYLPDYTVTNALHFSKTEFEAGLKRIAGLAKARRQKDYGCQKCLFKEACGHGCMASAVDLNRDPLANDGDCEFRKTQFIHRYLEPELKQQAEAKTNEP